MQVNAQTAGKNIPEENDNDTTLIVIQANDDYAALSPILKTEAINLFLKGINTELVSVGYGYKRELWRKDNVFGHFVLLDTLDMNNIRVNDKRTGKKLVFWRTVVLPKCV
jgi:hypothetical protein